MHRFRRITEASLSPPPVQGVHDYNEQPADRDSHIEKPARPHPGRFSQTPLRDRVDFDLANDTSTQYQMQETVGGSIYRSGKGI